MKKVYLLIGLVSVCVFNVNAQEIISTSGDYFENTNGSVSWTVGESMIETYTKGVDILTQGFQQGLLTAVSVFELKDIDISVKIAPNPTIDFINLYTDKFKDLTYQLYDFNGKIIKQADIISYETKISFSKLSYAAYFLKIMKGSQIIKTFQIIKQ